VSASRSWRSNKPSTGRPPRGVVGCSRAEELACSAGMATPAVRRIGKRAIGRIRPCVTHCISNILRAGEATWVIVPSLR
jgi:hypothetical protein